MVESEHQHFMALNRKLDDVHHKFILDCSKANIGLALTFKVLKEILSGFELVDCTVGDIKNASRDIKAYAHGFDVQMVLDDMAKKKEMPESFTYNYEVNATNQLVALFWCDGLMKRNYHMFGDIVAFDSTYNTNRYCMIFTPFTGKDNHGRPVTFTARLVCNEKTGAFAWLFKHFVECMSVAPKMITTDQDLGMRSAIEEDYVHIRIGEQLVQKILKPRANIAEFYLNFNNAVEFQRNSRTKLDYHDATALPILATALPFEKHASTLYTDSMFKKIQEEIVEGNDRCCLLGFSSTDMVDTYNLGENNHNSYFVRHDKTDDSYSCECKVFGGVEELGNSLQAGTPTTSASEKRRMIKEFYGMVRPKVVQVHPPDVVKTKGHTSSSASRLISKREKAIKEATRPLRRCKACDEMDHHDSRNCPMLKEMAMEKEIYL
ncbi:protein FAR1-RELATED SEQUENCE 5-like [Salvia splendens]|uniref:protein FAR1-RELATED SEQUENCE 5-like n=1 Tax=Salvia splendens TaxID=180675 RepID=UPI001C280F8B|nr:protein FAR1-RELATED SEQUENCE 5-like [Salvia splendens]